MKLFLLILLVLAHISFTMESTLSLLKAKDQITRCINLGYSDQAKNLLVTFGNQLTQEEKDKYLFNCYSRPSIVQLFLEIGANANTHKNCRCRQCAFSGLPNSCRKDSILHWAARYGNYGVVKALLQYKANPNALNSQDETPLMEACRVKALECGGGDARNIGHYIRVVRGLLSAGTNRTLISKSGKTALQIAQTEIADEKVREMIVSRLTLQKIA